MANDKIDIGTKQVQEELDALIIKLTKVSDIIAGITKLPFKASDTAGFNSEISKTSKKLTEMEKLTRALNIQKEKNALLTNKQNIELQKLRRTASNTNREIRKTTETTKKASGGILGMVKSVKALAGAFGVFLGLRIFTDIIRNVFTLTKEFDSLNFAMSSVIKTSFELASSQRFLLKITEDFGVELVSTTKRYIKFLAAAQQSNISMADTENIFRSVTKAAAVLGLKTDELTGVYLALEQMLSKGKVTTEELRRQLGERLPGAMGIMAAALDVTIPKLDEMLKKGQVLSADALPKFAEALELAFGIEAVDRVDTLVSSQNRLSNIWKLWVKDITEGDSALDKFFKGALDGLTDFVKMISSFTESPELRLQTSILEDAKRINVELKFETDVALKQRGVFIKDYTKLIKESRNKLLGVIGDPVATKKVEEQIRKLTRLSIDQNKEIEKERVKIAKTKIKSSIDAIKKTEDPYNLELSKLKQLRASYKKTEPFNPFQIKKRFIIASQIEAQEVVVKKLRDSFSEASASYEVFSKLLQVSKPTPIDPLRTGKAKEPKLVTDLGNKAEAERLKTLVEARKNEIALDSTTNDRRRELAQQNADDLLAIADSLQAQRDVKLNNDAANQKNKLAKDLENTKLSGGELVKLQDSTAIQISAIDQDLQNKLLISQEKGNQDRLDSKKYFADQSAKIDKDTLKKEIDEVKTATNLKLAEEINKHNKLVEQKKLSGKELEKAEFELQKALLKITIEGLKLQAEALKGIDDKKVSELLKKIAELETKLGTPFKKGKDAQKDFIDGLKLIGDLFGELSNLSNAFTETELQNLEKQREALDEKHESDLDQLEESTEASLEAVALGDESAEEKADLADGIRLSADAEEKRLAKEKEKRDEEFAKKEAKIKRKQAIIDKAAALVNIGINTAVAYTATLAQTGFLGIPLAQIVLALGAVQAATVLATPIPQFATGGVMGYDGDMMINDGGNKEYVERGGKILSTNKTNAVVKGQKGDVIHKDKNALLNSFSDNVLQASLMTSLISDRNNQNNSDNLAEIFNRNFDGFEKSVAKSVEKGIGKISIVNNNNNSSDYANYKASLDQ